MRLEIPEERGVRLARGVDPGLSEARDWILDTGCAYDLVQEDTLPEYSRSRIEEHASGTTLCSANEPTGSYRCR